ncbi:2-C-methyl-D-erythritol 4-phosphate cytidylyltransferase [Marinobacter sp. X15-166B]|uniref:2-C-methyl-D-erythritol 4-phosphate cytidylyltransferase n=1 Tax=Marinobacter sp. X15-166B TaxID=1897620 RepID=UPI00085CD3F3|nr:2-C-methyl-D-erythritol 4-phosphate cytidylyltransferase [Marinobacter sp. X15-166B]OEY67816.1 2-C-methyl-D-erythritol 4-phosphate cytidylyltransferase [Marinobacter sp. X15-166B]
MSDPRIWLVVPAAGVGQRMQADCPKQYLSLHGRFVLDITLARMLSALEFAGCMVALNANDPWWPASEASKSPEIRHCVGGAERVDSVLAALRALSGTAQPDDWVLVHDVARPCVAPEDVQRLVRTLWEHPTGGLLAAPVSDTLKRVAGNRVVDTVDRQQLWRALTPQMFRFGALQRALEQALTEAVAVTDEASAMEHLGRQPVVIAGRPDNIKITLPEDLLLAEFILGQLERGVDRGQTGK